MNGKLVGIHPKDLVPCQSCGRTMMNKDTGKCFSCGFVSAFSPALQEDHSCPASKPPCELGSGRIEYKKMNDETFDEDGTTKKEINNLIWMRAAPNLTLDQAENLAVKMFDLIRDTWGENEK